MGYIAQTPGGSTQHLSGAFGPDSVTVIIAANTNNLSAKGQGTTSLLKLDVRAAANLTGLAGGSANRQLYLQNIGSDTLSITSEDVLSTTANRFSSALSLTAGAIALVMYNPLTQRWDFISSSTAAPSGGAVVASSLTLTGPEILSGAAINAPAALAAGTTNNYNPANLATARVIEITPDAGGSSLSGLVAQSGHVITFVNRGVGDLTLLDENAGSTAANRFDLIADLTIPSGGSATLYYSANATRWVSL